MVHLWFGPVGSLYGNYSLISCKKECLFEDINFMSPSLKIQVHSFLIVFTIAWSLRVFCHIPGCDLSHSWMWNSVHFSILKLWMYVYQGLSDSVFWSIVICPVRPLGIRFEARNCISEPGPQVPYGTYFWNNQCLVLLLKMPEMRIEECLLQLTTRGQYGYLWLLWYSTIQIRRQKIDGRMICDTISSWVYSYVMDDMSYVWMVLVDTHDRIWNCRSSHLHQCIVFWSNWYWAIHIVEFWMKSPTNLSPSQTNITSYYWHIASLSWEDG
jgi:hypothetical protein